MSLPIYTFTPNTPNATDSMNVTQPLIHANFNSINELVDIDHIGFNVPNTVGCHQQLTMPMQLDIPVASPTDIVMFSQLTPDGDNAAELFGVWPSGDVFQLSNIGTTSGVTGSTSGWSQFPSGIIFKWGIISNLTVSSSSTSYTYTFDFPTDTGAPVFTSRAIYVQVAPINCISTTSVVYMLLINASSTLTTLSISYIPEYYNTSSFNVSYFVIGV